MKEHDVVRLRNAVGDLPAGTMGTALLVGESVTVVEFDGGVVVDVPTHELVSIYLITHGNIAALLTVTRPSGNMFDLTYSGMGRFPENVRSGSKDYETLPLQVQAAVNKQFGTVFSLPLESRATWIKQQMPFEVQVPG